jgi:hypothetical protein
MARTSKNDVTENLETAPDDASRVGAGVPMWDYYAAACLTGYVARGDLVEDACVAATIAADVMMKARIERAKQRDNKATYQMETGNLAYNQDLNKE